MADSHFLQALPGMPDRSLWERIALSLGARYGAHHCLHSRIGRVRRVVGAEPTTGRVPLSKSGADREESAEKAERAVVLEGIEKAERTGLAESAE